MLRLDPQKTVSQRTTTGILDFLGDVGGFFGALDLMVFMLAEYFAAKLFINSVANSMYK